PTRTAASICAAASTSRARNCRIRSNSGPGPSRIRSIRRVTGGPSVAPTESERSRGGGEPDVVAHRKHVVHRCLGYVRGAEIGRPQLCLQVEPGYPALAGHPQLPVRGGQGGQPAERVHTLTERPGPAVRVPAAERILGEDEHRL